MREPLSIWVQLLLCGGLAVGGYFGWQERESLRNWAGWPALASTEASERKKERGGAPVIVAPVNIARDTLSLKAVGTGLAQRSVMLRVEVSGKVAESALGSGRPFQKDDVLLRLNDRDQRLSLRLADTRLKEAERTRLRLERLRQTGAGTAVAFEEAVTAVEVARLEFERAREAALDRRLRAPFDGVSGLPSVEAGDWIEAGTQVASYDDRRTLLVEFDLPEALLGRVGIGAEVTATTPAVPGGIFSGQIASIDSRVSASTRTARVRVSIPNEGDTLRPGASFTIALELPGESFPVVPELALQFASGSLHVWRIVDGKAERVEVTLVRRRAGEVLVNGPLNEGDKVAVEGTQRLAPDREVEILEGQTSIDGEGSNGIY